MRRTDVVVIGGSDAGTAAAIRAREVDPGLRVTMLVADGYANYSVCGLPFLVSREVDDWRSLAHRSVAELRDLGIDVRLNHVVRAIDPVSRFVRVDGPDGRDTLAFEQVVIATGARPVRPHVDGIDLPGVHVLHTIDDGIRLRAIVDRSKPRTALVLGGGYIGVEMADALTRRGTEVTLVGRAATVLPTIAPSLGDLVRLELERNGVSVVTGTAITAISRRGDALEVTATDGVHLAADLIVVAAGVRPDIDLAVSAGARTGEAGAIAVDRAMATGMPPVWAAGDCVETFHRVLGRATYLPLGTTSHKQGHVAGENAAGGHAQFEGVVGTQVVKVFDLAAARTGLSSDEAARAGLDPRSVEIVVPDHKRYYPGANDLSVRITGDARSGQLLGMEIVGDWRAEVAKRVDVAAVALHHGLTVRQLNDLDLSYTPSLSSPWDPIQMAAQAWERRDTVAADRHLDHARAAHAPEQSVGVDRQKHELGREEAEAEDSAAQDVHAEHTALAVNRCRDE